MEKSFPPVQLGSIEAMASSASAFPSWGLGTS